jgi:hypothetical protein
VPANGYWPTKQALGDTGFLRYRFIHSFIKIVVVHTLP